MAQSLESALAEEAEEIRALLEGRQLKRNSLQPQRTASPAGGPKSPVRSMLDVDSPPSSARHFSIAGTNSGITRPSMLDPMGPSLGPPRNRSMDYRGMSKSPPPPMRRTVGPMAGLEDSYKFDMLPAAEQHALPKRVTQGGKKPQKNSMSSVFGRDGSLGYSGKDSRKNSIFSQKSISPGPPGRSKSPGTNLNSNSMNLMPTPGRHILDNGQVIDMNSAYRRLSDAALLKSGSGLANLPTRKGANVELGQQLAPDGGVRLTKDYTHPDDGDVESSDEDALTSDDDDYPSDTRGRGRLRKGSNDPGDRPHIRGAKSLLSAVEEERKDVAIVMPYRSLLDPEVKVTGPSGESLSGNKSSNKRGIHPSTSFDAHSDISTPFDSDQEEDLSDIRRAQKLDISISAIHSTPSASRSISQIIRGDFSNLQKEAEKGLRRQRMYLVATDISDEAAYALEWTIGTVLRDGDTLLAVYAVDEELGTGGDANAPAPPGSAHVVTNPHHSRTNSEPTKGADVVKDLGNISRTLSNEPGFHIPGSNTDADAPMSNLSGHVPDLARMDKAERERYHAVQEVTNRCVKLLRKTKLQVRVVVEVFHCKSPKHMITEVIDFLTPTLVVLGSRGRSALKGVLLGSFSNYLVTKSSVPVMVARKKLRKHSKTAGLRSQMRLSNMLSTGGSGSTFSRLTTAQIEKPIAHKTSPGGGLSGSGGAGLAAGR